MCHGSPRRPKRIIALALFLMAGLPACDRTTQSPEHIASYTFSQLTLNEPIGFVLQHSEKPVLLVRVEGHETAFESRLIAADGKELSGVRLPYLRVGPVFHVLEFHPDAAPVSVSVQPDHLTINSVIKVDVFALPAESERDEVRIQAYREYGLTSHRFRVNSLDTHDLHQSMNALVIDLVSILA